MCNKSSTSIVHNTTFLAVLHFLNQIVPKFIVVIVIWSIHMVYRHMVIVILSSSYGLWLSSYRHGLSSYRCYAISVLNLMYISKILSTIKNNKSRIFSLMIICKKHLKLIHVGTLRIYLSFVAEMSLPM